MLYEFRSRATGTVVMTADVAEPLLRAIGKEPTPTGIVTVAQLPDAIARLERAKAQPNPPALGSARPARPLGNAHDAGQPYPDPQARSVIHPDDDDMPVSFGQRAWPFLDLLQAAHAAGRDVVWGV